MSGRIKRRVTQVWHDLLVRAAVQKMVEVPIEKLGLDKTVPPFCRARGWPDGEQVDGYFRGHAFVAGVLSCYAAGAIHQRLGVPEFMQRHPQWGALVAEFGAFPEACMIVESFSPGHLEVGDARRLDSLLGIEAKREVLG